MGHPKAAFDPLAEAFDEVERLEARYGSLSTPDLLDLAIHDLYPGRVALVSSFGAEAAVLLHLVASVDRATPVLFVDTEKHFGETLRYRDRLVDRFGLADVRALTPEPSALQAEDPNGTLWYRSTDRCCAIRKVEPLARGMLAFDAWISGRKRFQAASRTTIPVFEAEGTRIKINPLASWMPGDLAGYVTRHDIPPHPLVADGYRSIGCMPCTDRVADGEDPRAGRWRGQGKVECGIHFGLLGGAQADGSGI